MAIKSCLRIDFTENAKTLSSVSKLRDMMLEKMLELRNAFEAVTEKVTSTAQLPQPCDFGLTYNSFQLISACSFAILGFSKCRTVGMNFSRFFGRGCINFKLQIRLASI